MYHAMSRKIKSTAIISVFFCAISCTEKAEFDSPENLEDIRAVVVSEGQFGYGTSSLTSLSYKGDVEQDLFRRINNRPMGDVAQSMTRIGDLLYVPQNNSKKIEVMDCRTFESVETMRINEDVIPMYVCHLGGDSIAVTDQKQNSRLIIMDINHGQERDVVRRTVSLGGGNRSFQMNLAGEKLFVGADKMCVFDLSDLTNKGMRYIRTQSGETIQTVDFSKIVSDKNGMIWALAYKYIGLNTNGYLYCIDPATETAVMEIDLASISINTWTSSLDISADGKTVYFNSHRRVYSVDTDNPQIPTQPVISPVRSDGRTVYNMCVSGENTIFLCEVLYGSLSRSRIYEYDLSGNELREFRAGLFSHFIYFY